jgi:membrane associated rhomboid family serine protease
LQAQYGSSLNATEAPATGKLFGPSRLAHRYLGDNDPVGSDLYLAEWGASGPAVQKACGQGWRYIGATFMHASMKHLLILGVVTMVSAALVERRCAAPALSSDCVYYTNAIFVLWPKCLHRPSPWQLPCFVA